MVLKNSDIEAIISYVKKEPRTMQEIARLLGKSWLTADSYVKQIKDKTGLVEIKTFREGTQGALKLVFYNYSDSLATDDVKEHLFHSIKSGRTKNDFDFMEIYQFIPQDQKKSFLEEYTIPEESKKQQVIPLFQQATSQIYCFSGNLSFINLQEDRKLVLDLMEELLRRKVRFKILTRVNIATPNNFKKLTPLLNKYPQLMEIRHCYQPLRGFIIDDKIAQFRNEEEPRTYKEGELNQNTRIFYEIYDQQWIGWLQKVFWNLFRSSIDYNVRLKEMEHL